MTPMRPRAVLLVGVLGLTAGWWMAAVVGPQTAGDAEQAPSRGPLPLGVERTEPPAPYTEQLRLRLERQPRTPQPVRNPFVFQARRPAIVSRAPAEPSTDDPTAGAPAEPPEAHSLRPTLMLSGIAANTVDGQVLRTAIITDGSDLYFAKVGEALPGGFTVVAIDDTTATLSDASGGERTLRLR
jgi:hypothetical protein